jgi:hypothetical protein
MEAPSCCRLRRLPGRLRRRGRTQWDGGEARGTDEIGVVPMEGRASVQEQRKLGSLSIPLSVQKLQTALQTKAKENAGFRFYSLYDKECRDDVLQLAYLCCKSNGGAAGTGGQ